MFDTFHRVLFTFTRFNEGGNDINHTVQHEVYNEKTFDELKKKYREYHIDHVGYVKCSCGREVACYAFTNTCQCGRDYNRFGQELAPIYGVKKLVNTGAIAYKLLTARKLPRILGEFFMELITPKYF